MEILNVLSWVLLGGLLLFVGFIFGGTFTTIGWRRRTNLYLAHRDLVKIQKTLEENPNGLTLDDGYNVISYHTRQALENLDLELETKTPLQNRTTK